MNPTASQIESALKGLGHYRCVRAQELVEGFGSATDGLLGSHVLALGMRETWGRNIEGGAMLVDNKWVRETDPTHMDVGWLQISRRYHADALKGMPGVKVGTWEPVVKGKTANDSGYAPRYSDSLRFTEQELRDAMAYAVTNKVKKADRVRFALAAHNAGKGGALSGYKAANVDKYTAMGDYSAWVLEAQKLVSRFLTRHDWIWTP